MTDKEQIKDSLKNHSQNFSENSTQEKEQIIIDGCNVSGCEYACNTAFGKNGCKHPMMKNIYCSKNPNCYFKQLARKTQECESWKKANDEKNKFLQDLGISASGEFKRIKFYIENLKNKYEKKIEELRKICLGSGMDFYLQKIETLEGKLNAQFTEMEEKLTAEEMKNYELKKKLRDLELKNTILRNRYQQLNGSITECDRYRKALEEIEEYLKEECGCECADCLEQGDCHFQEILNIINKAKGEGICNTKI